jgi:hypothetical protein
MATDPDVLQLVAILESEGFGLVAGELLAEVNQGPEVEVSRASDGAAPESDIVRKAVPEDHQFAFAVEFLRDRLVVPAQRTAEAERLAGQLGEGEPISIRFLTPGDALDDGLVLSSTPGEAAVAEKLDALLKRLPDLRREDGAEEP